MTLQAACPLASAYLLVLLVLAATDSSFSTGAHHAGGDSGCRPHEREALLSFKQGITGDPRGILASWRGGGEDEQDCCRWRGVRCSNRTGRVLKLYLQDSHISYDDYGQRSDDGGLVGKTSRSLLSLDQLEYLDLSMNHLQGRTGRIPAFLGSFSNLRYLNLSGIPFSGRVPPQLGNLSRLHYLDRSNSQVTMLYSTDLSWLTHLPMLQHLNMESVNLSKIVDWHHVVNMIPSLKVLNLFDCKLTSGSQSLPRLNLTNLEELVLVWNNFGQPLVSCWFWNVTSLKYLNLAATNLYGPLPDTVGDLPSLQILDLSVNHGMDLNNLRKLCNLRILYLTSFSYPFGNISKLIGMLPRCSSNRLQELYLGGNELAGFLPKRIEHFTNLVVLDLSSNNITGPLPGFVGHFRSLRILDLSSNQLSGHVPSEIGMLTNLTKLNLCNNDLDGLITEEHLGGLQSLEYVCLSGHVLVVVAWARLATQSIDE